MENFALMEFPSFAFFSAFLRQISLAGLMSPFFMVVVFLFTPNCFDYAFEAPSPQVVVVPSNIYLRSRGVWIKSSVRLLFSL